MSGNDNTTVPSNTVTAAEAPTNSDAVEGYSDQELICDRTGFKIPISEGLMEEWNGRMVRKESFEPRHPQDFVRGVSENQEGSPRPEQGDRFIGTDIPAVTTDDL